VAYMGLVAGLVISFLAREELKEGQRYFVLLQHSVVVVVFLVFMRVLAMNTVVSVFFAVVLVLALQSTKRFDTSVIVYPLLAVVVFFSRVTQNSLFVTAALVFVYGLATAAMQLDVKKKNYLLVLGKNIGFVVVSVILFLIA
jgi:hypothetical protein